MHTNRVVERPQHHAGVAINDVQASVEEKNFQVSNKNIRCGPLLRHCFHSECLKRARQYSYSGSEVEIRSRNEKAALHLADIIKNVIFTDVTQKRGRN